MDKIKKCLEIVDTKIFNKEDGMPFFRDKEVKVFSLKPEYVQKIKIMNTERVISFVDGGNNTIISTPDFHIELCSIYFNMFQNNNKINPSHLPSKIYFYTLITRRFVSPNDILLETEIIPFDEKYTKYLPDVNLIKINEIDETIKEEVFGSSLSKIGNIVRRFAEWKYSQLIIEQELHKNDLIVHDGTLQTGIRNESIFSDKAFESATKKNVIFSGFAKTTGMITTTGKSLAKVIKKIGDQKTKNGIWYYNPIAENIPHDDGEIFFIKLHRLSKPVFRFEIYKEQFKEMDEYEINSIFSDLVLNSKDISFLGYPYGLIDADKYAAVSYKDCSKQKTIFLALSKNKKEISESISMIDAHDILNKIRIW